MKLEKPMRWRSSFSTPSDNEGQKENGRKEGTGFNVS